MAEAPFVVLVVLYAIVAAKVDQWFTISRLGFKSYTPQGFLEHPRAYQLARMVLFGAACMALFVATAIPWYFGVVALAVVWLGAFWIGRRAAFNTFRQIHRKMIEYEDAVKVSDPSEYARILDGEDGSARRAELEEDALRTNRELAERVAQSIRWGI